MNTQDTTRKRRAQTSASGQNVRQRAKKPRKGPDVVYTQPGPFNRNRFLLHLLTIIAVVLAVTFAVSLFFTVKHVEVSGMDKYTAWQIREASGIKEGENLLAVGRARISSLIEDRLPYVNKVRVKISLPDTVCIYVEELEVVYAVESVDDQWWLMRADGRIVDKTTAAEAERYTKIEGIQLTDVEVGKAAVAAESAPDATNAAGETVPVTVTGKERLDTAVAILGYLEANGIIGEVETLQVDNLNDLQLWYEDRFQVLLGDSDELSYKISAMKSAIDRMSEYQTGILDVSFTVDTGSGRNEVIHTPFS